MLASIVLLLAAFAIFGKVAAFIVMCFIVLVIIALAFFGWLAFSFITDIMNLRN